MPAKLWITACLCLFAVIIMIGGATAQPLGVGTSPQGTNSYATGAAIAKVVSAEGGIALRVQPFTSTTAALPLLDSGELDFVVTNVVEARMAAQGIGVYAGRKHSNIMAVSVLYPLRVGFFVRQVSAIHAYRDLAGTRLPVGFKGHAIAGFVTDVILATANLNQTDYRPVPVINIIRGASDFATGKLDAFFFSLGSAKVTEIAANIGGLRLLPMIDSEHVRGILSTRFPEAYLSIVKPSSSNVGVERPTPALTYDYVLLSARHVPSETVYRITEILHRGGGDLERAFHLFGAFEPARMFEAHHLVYHSGAAEFYRESTVGNSRS